ncbi:dTMP kinase [Bacilliculturomica massiliensis]|uniref:dTMP kinase n=1 Tax=Bacilliculturomica massiliensis TaxID=1917867 RepID=UPI001031786F|nr:dTMP kinase [Bacilliculturomica massiliensis]
MSEGLFITFEGPDGSGKTTQIQRLKALLEERGIEAVLTREPGGTPIGEKIREIILDRENGEMDSLTEAFLYASSRAQHVAQVIKPALEAGKTVICDRFTDSSIVYQGYGRGLGDRVRVINQIAVQGLEPDVTFFLKLPPQTGKDRIKAEEQDRMELEKIEFHNEVFHGYEELERMEPERFIAVDAARSIDEVAGEIRLHMCRLLEKAESEMKTERQE